MPKKVHKNKQVSATTQPDPNTPQVQQDHNVASPLHNVTSPLKQLSIYRTTNFPVLPIGNDPVIKINDERKTQDEFVLIGTSGLRSLQIASDIGGLAENTNRKVPQLIIIDNSRHVCNFWKLFKDAVASCKDEKDLCETMDRFFKNLSNQVTVSHGTTRELQKGTKGIEYPDQENASKFVIELSRRIGFKQFMELVNTTLVLQQSWTDEETFTKLKEILGNKKVYMYPSNILASTSNFLQFRNKILQNIEVMNPVYTIHTDCIYTHKLFARGGMVQPHKVYFIDQMDNRNHRKVDDMLPPVMLSLSLFKREMAECLIVFLAVVAAIIAAVSYKLQDDDATNSKGPRI